jgi:PAS domain S-box-containing protein
LTGLVLLAWPYLVPPLPDRWADRLAGIGLIIVALACGASLFQRLRGAFGISPMLRPAITWPHGALTLAGLASLNQSSARTRRQAWLLTTAGALVGGVIGLMVPLPLPRALAPVSNGAMAVLAAGWLTWMDRLPPKKPRVMSDHRGSHDAEITPGLLEASRSLSNATNLPQLLEAATVALNRILAVRSTALVMAEDSSPEDDGPLHLRLAARSPLGEGQETFSPLPIEPCPPLTEALRRECTVNVIRKAEKRRFLSLEPLLGATADAALIMPLMSLPAQSGAKCADGVLVVGYAGAPLDADQLRLCHILADQVAITATCIRSNAKIEQQSRTLTRIVRRQEHATRQSHAILESIADGIIVSDANDQVVLTNSAALGILGMERHEVLGKPFGQIMGCMVPAGEVGIIGELTKASSYGMEAVFEVSDRVVQTSIGPVENGEGIQLGVVAVLRDVTALASAEVERDQLMTELQEHSQQLEAAAEQLRELDLLKSQLIASISHELRTPLNSIIGFSGVMLKEIDGKLTEAQREDLQAIHTGGKHLLGLITDILDISQIWAGKMDLTLSDVDLPEIIEDAMTIAAPLIGEKPIELMQTLDSNLPLIQADKTRTRQILLNLLTNAIKYTKEGQITVSASRDDDWMLVSVADTGIGIPPEHIDNIFEEFGRVDSSSTQKVGGLGLGLAICRELAELHGGQIWAESEVGVGSTFYLNLPIDGPPSASADRKLIRRRLAAALAQWA